MASHHYAVTNRRLDATARSIFQLRPPRSSQSASFGVRRCAAGLPARNPAASPFHPTITHLSESQMGSFQHEDPSCPSSLYANRLALASRSFLVCRRETTVDVSGCISLVINAPLTALFQVIGRPICPHSTTYPVCFLMAEVDGWDGEAGRGVHRPCFEPGGVGGIQDERLGRSRVDPSAFAT